MNNNHVSWTERITAIGNHRVKKGAAKLTLRNRTSLHNTTLNLRGYSSGAGYSIFVIGVTRAVLNMDSADRVGLLKGYSLLLFFTTILVATYLMPFMMSLGSNVLTLRWKKIVYNSIKIRSASRVEDEAAVSDQGRVRFKYHCPNGALDDDEAM